MAILISGTTNDIIINGASVATDAEVSSAVIDAVTTAGIALKTIATGTATFTATTNNINLTGIGVGVEIGDVIQISGANDAKNNSEFTIEVITDANNIIVNQAHANKGTSKNVSARTGDTSVTIKLLAKWYNAPMGLGQDWVNVTTSRSLNVIYPNNTNRTFVVSALHPAELVNANLPLSLIIGGTTIVSSSSNAAYPSAGFISGEVTKGANYMISPNSGTLVFTAWLELR